MPKWTMIYNHWYVNSSDYVRETKKQVTEGQDGVSEIYVRKDGYVEIRYQGSLDTDFIPISQVLVIRSRD